LVADLQQRLVYVYFMFQYDAPIVLSIDEELARPQASRPLSELFPAETQRHAEQAYQRLVTRSARCDLIGFIWLGIVVLSFIALLLLARLRGRRLAFWAPVVAVLGPAGLLAWLVAAPARRPRALVESVGDLVPCVVGLVLLALYFFPLIIGLFLYQAPLLARATGSSYLHTVWRRLPDLLVSTNLALGGLLATSLPLIDWHTNYCGLSTFSTFQWWAIAVLGALVGGLLLLLYHAWAIRRGFTAWSTLLWDKSEAEDKPATVLSPTWRHLWLWILLSFMILVGGVALGILGISLAAALR
jgi:hypothetical protein